MWHDSPGLRPVMRDLGRRVAAEGYSVLVPNLFYRTARAPVFDETFDYAKNPAAGRIHLLREARRWQDCGSGCTRSF